MFCLTGLATFVEVVGLGAGSGTSDGPELVTEPGSVPDNIDVGCDVTDRGQDRTPLPEKDLVDSGLESDSYDIVTDATRVGEAYYGKREHAGTGSNDSDPELSQARKKGKEIQAGLHQLQCCQDEGEALAVDVAATVPLPSDDDDDDETNWTLITDTPTDPDPENNSTNMDSSLMTTPVPKPTVTKTRGTTSQPSSGNDPCVRKPTRPPPLSASQRAPKC